MCSPARRARRRRRILCPSAGGAAAARDRHHRSSGGSVDSAGNIGAGAEWLGRIPARAALYAQSASDAGPHHRRRAGRDDRGALPDRGHRPSRIFRDAFRLRARDKGGVGLADWHNRLGVWTLPFTLAVSLTGAMIGLATVNSYGLASAFYKGDVGEAAALCADLRRRGGKNEAGSLRSRPRARRGGGGAARSGNVRNAAFPKRRPITSSSTISDDAGPARPGPRRGTSTPPDLWRELQFRRHRAAISARSEPVGRRCRAAGGRLELFNLHFSVITMADCRSRSALMLCSARRFCVMIATGRAHLAPHGKRERAGQAVLPPSPSAARRLERHCLGRIAALRPCTVTLLGRLQIGNTAPWTGAFTGSRHVLISPRRYRPWRWPLPQDLREDPPATRAA